MNYVYTYFFIIFIGPGIFCTHERNFHISSSLSAGAIFGNILVHAINPDLTPTDFREMLCVNALLFMNTTLSMEAYEFTTQRENPTRWKPIPEFFLLGIAVGASAHMLTKISFDAENTRIEDITATSLITATAVAAALTKIAYSARERF